MKQAKGKYCGDFKPAKTAAHFSPFFGKYARSGGRGTGDASSTDSPASSEAARTAITPATPTRRPTPDKGKKDKGGGKKGFNPDLYESPPQGPPAAKPARTTRAAAPRPPRADAAQPGINLPLSAPRAG